MAGEWTTDDVRFWVTVGGGNNPVAVDALRERFDSWVAEHDRYVRAGAWYDGHYATTAAAIGA